MELAFYLSGFVAILATLRVITHNQPIHALLYFIISLLAIACVFFSLGAYFAGALEIIIYAGAIMVLFIFVIMMLNTSVSHEKQKSRWFRPRVWIGPAILSLILLAVLVNALSWINAQGMSGEIITPKTVGIALFGPYVLAVELASMLLLAGLVGAFHLGRHDRVNLQALYKEANKVDTIKSDREGNT
ncbi:NADH-quinone oxidoreductase subunit J [secondary endosymbiont of Ctenarytaina eucalypti]|uniref:NADH-quinone oxidoreductase subunit J n=1 Tax=secondary endosymbiont of Ctenarytaina eucalypti TaxID=1199245 RepID=J3TXM7_9ENTR|nr:NADH-quinone oxidoreductase subunit J [secondary endosymbiont of Ctenarytaina eucalypti]AFP84975.1 NADH:ubiquinone oxidoreductase subunit 6 (chain J) [secondary endosymbiont of Ctenarytaina eucalypti]